MESFTGKERSSGPAVAEGRGGGSWRKLLSGWRQASNMHACMGAGRERPFEIGEIADALPGIDPHDQRHDRILRRNEASRDKNGD
jgi:hypothetical protein